MILNKSSVERGFAHGRLIKTEMIDLREDKGSRSVFAAEPLRPGQVGGVWWGWGGGGGTGSCWPGAMGLTPQQLVQVSGVRVHEVVR
jgi:hypothetical protein